jgi:hypothetical protein
MDRWGYVDVVAFGTETDSITKMGQRDGSCVDEETPKTITPLPYACGEEDRAQTVAG